MTNYLYEMIMPAAASGDCATSLGALYPAEYVDSCALRGALCRRTRRRSIPNQSNNTTTLNRNPLFDGG